MYSNAETMRWLIPLSMAFNSMVALAGDIACASSHQAAERVICDNAIQNRQYDRIYNQQQKLLDAGKVSTDQIAPWRQELDTCSDVTCVDVVFQNERRSLRQLKTTKRRHCPTSMESA